MSVVSVRSPAGSWIRTITSRANADAPAFVDWVAALATAGLLVLSFPNFELAYLAWIGLIPLLVVIARHPSPLRALILGWATGTVFFYATCYWLTYSMIHYGGLPSLVAYLLLIPGAIIVGLFPGLFTFLLAFVVRRWGPNGLLLSPYIWVAMEYARLGVTGQLWNSLGYSQAFHPSVIQTASLGGVYLVSFLVVTANAAIAFGLSTRTARTAGVAVAMVVLIAAIAAAAGRNSPDSDSDVYLTIIALQPNVPMNLVKTTEEMQQLFERHLTMSRQALKTEMASGVPRLLIWPESPMNFTYSSDRRFQEILAGFATENNTAILFNSQEPAPGGGTYNSAVLINEKGRMISQYDKIRLLPFGEYVPLPRWLPGASLITGLVGDFTPGANYTLMPVSEKTEAGVFICVESAYPSIARAMTRSGAGILINISNDGYLGPTAVMRQHLANAVFRAVENDRTVIRVTNSGITALIESDGLIRDQTNGFVTDFRVWQLVEPQGNATFYSTYGDVFSISCLVLTGLAVLSPLLMRRKEI